MSTTSYVLKPLLRKPVCGINKVAKSLLTILTDPIPAGREFLPEGTRRLARRLKYALHERSYGSHPRYRGHFAVTRSLIEGLEKIGASFNYNPSHLNQLADTVAVIAGVRTLRQAISLKRQGRIHHLFAGPNIVVFSSDYDSILAVSEVDAAITPCDWVIDVYLEDNPSLKGRIFSWPAGVDTDYWMPSCNAQRNSILIFEKQSNGLVGPVGPYANYLRSLGWAVDILSYGTYRHHQYRDFLHQCCLLVGFVTGESQGIAWAEAWAADVPTLLWRNTSNIYRGRRYRCSTAPYLCDKTGLFFDNLEHFKEVFAYWQAHRARFTPRAWTLANMSDEVCARKLCETITKRIS